MPLPVRGTPCGLPGAVSVTTSVADLAPVEAGANLSSTAQLAFGATVDCSHESAVLMKALRSGPTTFTELTLSAMTPLPFEITTLCGSPIVVAGWSPNGTEAG